MIAEARAAGLLVLVDAKRGDIDSTVAAYADAWLGEGSPLAGDAVTVHPYLVWCAGALVNWRPRRPRCHCCHSEFEHRRAGVAGSDDGGGASVEDMLLAEIAAWNNTPGYRGDGRGVHRGDTSPSASHCPSWEG